MAATIPPGLDNAKNSYHYAPMRDFTFAAGVTTTRSCGGWMKDTIEPRDMIAGKQFQR